MAAPATSTTDAAAPSRARKVLMGTCGWSDVTLMRCGKFYPSSVRTAEDRLRHYSSHFPCVEVDTSTYAIPSPVSVGRWVSAVSPGFLFHFKAFGLFCSKSGAVSTIPGRVRSTFALPDEQQVKLYDLPSDVRDEIWSIFNAALEPAHRAGRLGVVVFQFHLSFKPTEEHHAHVLWCRRNLDARYAMAVEFRSREWFTGERKGRTESWLAAHGLALIAADELEHETFQRDRQQTGPGPGQRRVVLPVAWPSLHPDYLYVRVHRREGNQRVLSDEELDEWAARLGPRLPPGLRGPVYFMWGTDWEDQPLINAKRLAQRLPKDLVFDWKATQKGNNRLQSMFRAVSSKAQQREDSAGRGLVEVPETRADLCTPLPNSESPWIEGGGARPGNGEADDVVRNQRVGSANSSLCHSDMSDISGIASTQGIDPSECSPLAKIPGAFESSPSITGSQLARADDESATPLKPAPPKAAGLSPAKEASKKVNPAKKARTSGNTPAITSFFKRATPSDS